MGISIELRENGQFPNPSLSLLACLVLFDVLIKPSHSLKVRRLLCEFLLLDLEIGANGETMLNTTVKSNLIRQLLLLKNILNFPPQLSRENLINLRSSNTQWTLCRLNLFRRKERRMSYKTRVDAFSGSEVTDDVFAAEAIAYGADTGDSVGSLQVFDHDVEDWVDYICWVGFYPGHYIEGAHSFCEDAFGDGVSAEDVGDYDEVACAGQVVCEAVLKG